MTLPPDEDEVVGFVVVCEAEALALGGAEFAAVDEPVKRDTAHAITTITSSAMSAISGQVHGLRRRLPSSGPPGTGVVAVVAPVGGAPAAPTPAAPAAGTPSSVVSKPGWAGITVVADSVA